jgi:hypothetical protein
VTVIFFVKPGIKTITRIEAASKQIEELRRGNDFFFIISGILKACY